MLCCAVLISESIMEVIVALVFMAVIVVCYVIAKTRKGGPPTTAPQIAASQIAAPRIAYSGKSYPFSEVTNDANFPHVRSIHTKIRGVTKENPDGSNRQQIISQCCRRGDALFLVREPNNPAGRDAIQVRRIVYSDVPDDSFRKLLP